MKQFDINTQSKRNPFTVPYGYFENLTARVMMNIPEVDAEEKESESHAKIVSMEPRKSSRKWMGWSIAQQHALQWQFSLSRFQTVRMVLEKCAWHRRKRQACTTLNIRRKCWNMPWWITPTSTAIYLEQCNLNLHQERGKVALPLFKTRRTQEKPNIRL